MEYLDYLALTQIHPLYTMPLARFDVKDFCGLIVDLRVLLISFVVLKSLREKDNTSKASLIMVKRRTKAKVDTMETGDLGEKGKKVRIEMRRK